MKGPDTFLEIAAILGLATVTGLLGQKLRQPLVIMFLATGILAGPSFFGIIQSYEQIELLAHIGIALLLFIVGLKLDLKLIRTTGPVALATGIGQIVFTSLIGFGICLAMGMSYLAAGYVSVALTFSSTIIIVKLLSDKKEIDSLHGQIALGFLIVQDIAAILALVILTTLGTTVSAGTSGTLEILTIAAKGVGLLIGVGLLMKFVIPYLTRRLAHSLELMTLFAITWAVLLGAASDLLGFSKEVGAFLAGISLASTSYRDSIGARLTSLRDFLLLFFFIDLGSRLDWSMVGAQWGAAVIFSVFVLIGNPLIVLIIMGVMGYRRRTGFLAGLTVAQISEFSLIVAALGLSLGHITEPTMGLITLVGVVTIFVSTYMILYSYPLYRMLSGPLKIFELRNPYREAAIDTEVDEGAIDAVLVGLGKYGSGLGEHLLRRQRRFVGVDFDPAALERWRRRHVAVLYGDIADPEMYEHLPLGQARWVISAVRSKDASLALIRNLRQDGFAGKIAVTASDDREAAEYEKAGAHLVFRPFRDATEQAADALTHAMDVLPTSVDWPISFLEMRIRSDASAAGRALRELRLSAAGVSVLALSRGGAVHHEPAPDFRIFPSDRLLLMGSPHGLMEAEALLNQLELRGGEAGQDRFEIAEIEVAADSAMDGKTIAEVKFRQRHGATLVGIRRGEEQITTIGPAERIAGGDHLIVIGKTEAVEELKGRAPL